MMLAQVFCRSVLRRPCLLASTIRTPPRVLVQPAVDARYESSSSSTSGPRSRRRRKASKSSLISGHDNALVDQPEPSAPSGLAEPFSTNEKTTDDYLKKASLSPWVPTPDPVARKMLELANVDADDIHVELGSGDGRLNFHAIDPPYSVKKSTGIDNDESLINISKERITKRYPPPTNVEFIHADLELPDIYESHVLKEATVITMYFVEDALKRIMPRLIDAIKGRDVRIVTCGYAMPNWDPKWVEVILGLSIYYYEVKAAEGVQFVPTLEEMEDAAEAHEELRPVHLEDDDGVKIIPTPLFDPDEKIDGHWDTFDEEEDEDADPDENPILEKYRTMSLQHKKKK